jgi:hypothetical protein
MLLQHCQCKPYCGLLTPTDQKSLLCSSHAIIVIIMLPMKP